MKIKYISSYLALIICMLSTGSAFAFKPIYKNILNNKSTEIDVKDFNGIAAGGPIQVIVKLGNTESCRFEGDEEAISTLVAEVKGKTLILRPQNSWQSWERKYKDRKITAYVTAKNLAAVTMSGSGGITVNGKIDNSSLAITLSGSGYITVDSSTDKLNVVMSGSGTVNINGSARKADITMSGSGSFKGKTFKVNDLSTRMSGSGVVYITAENKIDALISGSANVIYSGSATVDKNVLGSGTVKKI